MRNPDSCGTKICHLTSVHNRYDGRILKRECTSLVELGYDVTLLVADDLSDEEYLGVHIRSIGRKPANRIERMLLTSRALLNKAKSIDAEVYHFHDPELLPIGKRLKKLGKKVIFDSHEDTVDQILEKKYLLIPKFFSKIFEIYQNSAIRKLDAIVIVSPSYRTRFLIPGDRVYMVTNYPELHPFPDRKNVKKQVCFTGGCSQIWCNLEISKAVSELDCDFVMAGPGDAEYISEAIDAGKEKTIYLGQLDQAQVYNLHSESMAGMMVCKSEQILRNGGTLGNTKMFEYMMNGLPIICSDVKLWREIVEKYECGICVNPKDIIDIKRAIEFIVLNEDRAIEMGKNGRKAVESSFNWAEQKKELKRLYEKII